ncbi:MAG: choice-of-anchor V domain-containing protein [Saprospiraceae bacterium]
MTKRFTLYLMFFSSALLLLSNASGVPQAVTMAPGESGKNCGACHIGGNHNTTVQLTVKDLNGELINQYSPSTKYQLEVKVLGENNPKSYGFQMVSLSELDQKDMGNWSSLGQKVKNQTMLQRKYLVQSGHKQDGIFTMQWTAPTTDIGSVVFYFSGLTVNLNGDITGDTPTSNRLTLASPTTSSDSKVNNIPLTVFPNPAKEILYVQSEEYISSLKIRDMSGKLISESYNFGFLSSVDIQSLHSGMYILEILFVNHSAVQTSKFFKF